MSLTNLKRLFIPAIIGIALVIIGVNLFLSRPDNTESNPNQTNETGEGFTVDSETYPLSIPFSATSEVVDTEDYLEGQPVGNPEIPSSQAIQFVQTDKYVIHYTQSSDSFLISIQSSPFDGNRQDAENAFLEALDITREDACKLDVSTTTPQWANPDETGTIYRLSFCTNN